MEDRLRIALANALLYYKKMYAKTKLENYKNQIDYLEEKLNVKEED